MNYAWTINKAKQLQDTFSQSSVSYVAIQLSKTAFTHFREYRLLIRNVIHE